MAKTITVAIVTARKDQDTSYEKWKVIREKFLNRDFHSSHINGELASLMAACLGCDVENHVDYQLRALALGTRIPDRILIVDRARDDFSGHLNFDVSDIKFSMAATLTRPLISKKEIELAPEAAIDHVFGNARTTEFSLGCSDKNTAIALCETDHLVMLDDCCLPGFGLVQAAGEICDRGEILLVGHKKIKIKDDEFNLDSSTANWAEKITSLTLDEAKSMRRVAGCWAMPISIALALNGFNECLDGFRGHDDMELLERMDRHVKAREIRYAMSPAARIYEIDHGMPWKDGEVKDWQEFCPEGWQWRAPEGDLVRLRERLGVSIGSDIFGVEMTEDYLEEDDAENWPEE